MSKTMPQECQLFVGPMPSQKCDRVPGESGYCPRHAFMVENLGIEKTKEIEYPGPCPVCGIARPNETFAACSVCKTECCAACREAESCCEDDDELDSEITALESKIMDLEEEIDELRERQRAARRKAS